MTGSTDRPHRVWRLTWVVGGLLAAAVLLLLARQRPMAPDRIRLLTGPAGSAYHAWGEAFSQALAKRGIKGTVIETRGAMENLERLGQEDGPTLAFAQSNIERELTDPAKAADLATLGSLAFEPMWIFVRRGLPFDGPLDLRGMRVALGRPGTGSRTIALMLLEANGLEGEIDTHAFEGLGQGEVGDALRHDRIDAAFVVGSTRSEAVDRLLRTEGITGWSMKRADAYDVRFPGLVALAVPEGVVDLAENIPDRPLETLAATTSMVAHEDLHDSLVAVLIAVAREVQPPASLESPAGVFPTAKYASLRVAATARRIYDEGPPPLSRIFPYRLAALLGQIAFVWVPALAVLAGILKVVPAALGARYAFRAFRLTRRLMQVERGLMTGEAPQLLARTLDEVDAQSTRLHVPPTKAGAFLELRQNIHDARERLADRARAGSEA